MSKSVKRNNKYSDDYEHYGQNNQRDRIKEKRLRAALKSKNVNALLGLGYSLIELKQKSQAKIIFEDLKKNVKEPTLLEEVNKALESLK
jgi:Holliday junction resolvasome RuvABC DNA-binding subunit